MILFTPGPFIWKLWMFDLSLTVILYEPALSVFTLAVPFLRVMVKPGPTVPVNFVTLLVAPIGAARASAATRPATSSAIRDIVLLWRNWLLTSTVPRSFWISAPDTRDRGLGAR